MIRGGQQSEIIGVSQEYEGEGSVIVHVLLTLQLSSDYLQFSIFTELTSATVGDSGGTSSTNTGDLLNDL